MKKKEVEELQSKMTFNENGEGVIDGKTIRDLEAEIMKQHCDSSKVALPPLVPRRKRAVRHKQTKTKFRKNVEILVGLIVIISFIAAFCLLKTGDPIVDSSLLGGLLGGLGAIIAILLSISFSKRSNEQALDSSVLPYIIVKRLKESPSDYSAHEFFSTEDSVFSGWRPFDFNSIKENKRTLVRNGIAYLQLKNIGLGPAKDMEMYIDNFGKLYLDKDDLQPGESMNLILNFSNPDTSLDANFVIDYKTIRNVNHSQGFHANITWHLDRTNFTLFR